MIFSFACFCIISIKSSLSKYYLDNTWLKVSGYKTKVFYYFLKFADIIIFEVFDKTNVFIN